MCGEGNRRAAGGHGFGDQSVRLGLNLGQKSGGVQVDQVEADQVEADQVEVGEVDVDQVEVDQFRTKGRRTLFA
jgi:hypothetical protein